jgi:N-carbamoylputrescine amidase
VREGALAVTQFACGDDHGANADRAEALVRQAAAEGAQVILLQELFHGPYFCKTEHPR